MGGLWIDYERSQSGGLVEGSPRNQQTNIPGLYAIGECDYQYHGANRLGANSLLSCIFSGLFVAPGVVASVDEAKRSEPGPQLLNDASRPKKSVTSIFSVVQPAVRTLTTSTTSSES